MLGQTFIRSLVAVLHDGNRDAEVVRERAEDFLKSIQAAAGTADDDQVETPHARTPVLGPRSSVLGFKTGWACPRTEDRGPRTRIIVSSDKSSPPHRPLRSCRRRP